MDTSADRNITNKHRISGKTTKFRNVHTNVVSKSPYRNRCRMLALADGGVASESSSVHVDDTASQLKRGLRSGDRTFCIIML